MKSFAKLLFILSLSIGGLAVWQAMNPPATNENQDPTTDDKASSPSIFLAKLADDLKGVFGMEIEGDEASPDNFTDTSTVTLQGQQVSNRCLPRSRQEIQSFDSFPLDFDVVTIEGKPLRKDDFAGRVLIIDIWATWCPPCRAEIPSFVELQDKYFDAGLSIVGMNYERAGSPRDAILTINEFRRTQPINYPLAIGDESLTNQVPRFSGYPTTLFIDAKGQVRMKLVGAHPVDVLESYALALLSEIEHPAESPAGAKPPRALPKALQPGISSQGPSFQENPYANSQSI